MCGVAWNVPCHHFVALLGGLINNAEESLLKIVKLTTVAALWLALAIPASAESIADAAQDLCEMVKECSLAQIKKEDLTPELLQMMEPMLENMCANMRNQVQEVPDNHALYGKSIACMRSMEAVGCAGMENPAGFDTPACQEFQQLVSESDPG